MYVIIKIHLWHNRDQYAFCLKKIKGIDILEVAQRLGLPVTSYKKKIHCLVGMYKWQNFTYMNTRSVTLGFFNDKLDPVNSIRFDKYELTEINFSGDTFNPYQQNSPCYHVKDTRAEQSLSIEHIPLANFQQVLNTIWEAENKE